MPTGTFLGGWSTPGSGSLDITSERNIITGWGSINNLTIIGNAVLDGAARDSGNSPTNVCRSGLTLGVITATGHYTTYAIGNSDGSQKPVGFLLVEALTQDFTGNNSDRAVPVMLGGMVKASQLLGLDPYARSVLSKQFIFDDDLQGKSAPIGRLFSFPVPKATNYTVKASDNGTTFTTTGASGAVVFTLPALAGSQGLYFQFWNTVNQNMTISSAEGTNMIMPGFTQAAGGSNAAFTTSGQKAGSTAVVYSDGSDWYVENRGGTSMTTS